MSFSFKMNVNQFHTELHKADYKSLSRFHIILKKCALLSPFREWENIMGTKEKQFLKIGVQSKCNSDSLNSTNES